MSQQGYLVWYTEARDLDSLHILNNMSDLMGVFPDRLGHERASHVDRTVRSIIKYDDDDMDSTIRIADNVMMSELHRLFVPDTSIHVATGKAAFGERIAETIADEVSPDVRGDFLPTNPYFIVGRHYLYDGANEKHIASPTVTVGVWGYSSPRNWKEMTRLVRASNALRNEQTQLEHLLGSLTMELFWYI
jgi:hypothetical protein